MVLNFFGELRNIARLKLKSITSIYYTNQSTIGWFQLRLLIINKSKSLNVNAFVLIFFNLCI